MKVVWTIRLFGGVSIEGEQPLPCRFETRRGELLLARLALARSHTCNRDQLADALWPDDFVEASRPRLRQEIARLKRALGAAAEILKADRMNVALDDALCVTDIDRFRDGLRAAERETDSSLKLKVLESTTGIQTGDLLPGHSSSWLVAEREELKRAHVAALLTMCDIWMESGDVAAAVEHARDAARLAPLDEGVHLKLIDLLTADGRTADALSHYVAVERMFLATVGVRPSARLVDRVEQARDRNVQPPAILRLRRHALPAVLGSFVGRVAEMARISELFQPDGARLVTLSGPGGMGKTRLALEAGRTLRALFGENIWFVRLVDVHSPSHIGETLLNALGIDDSVADPIDAAARALPEARSLIILDNFEQLVDGGSLIVRHLLEACPHLHLLVTTRRKLNLGGEVELPLGPLGFEHGERASSDLFFESARSTRFLPDDDEARTMVAEIVRRLEGIPLAIHLSAAKIGVLTLEEILQQLSSRFSLLVSDRVDLDERHRTLRRTIAWSFDLLRPECRTFFTELSVFRGGWTAALAEEVLERPNARQLLQELRDNSFVADDPNDTVMRFTMLETLREFADDRLDPERKAELRRRLALAMSKVVEQSQPELLGRNQMEWYRRLDADIGNLRAALKWASEEDPALGIAMCGVLWRFWSVRGHQNESVEWFDLFLGDERMDSETRIWPLFGAARCAADQGDYSRALAWFARTKVACLQQSDERMAATVDINVAGLRVAQSRFQEAVDLYQAVLPLFESMGLPYNCALCRDELGEALTGLGKLDEAGQALEKAHAFYETCPDRVAVGHHLATQGRWSLTCGDAETARAKFDDALAIHNEFGNPRGIAWALLGLAELAAATESFAEANGLIERALEQCNVSRDRFGKAHALYWQARIAAKSLDHDLAADLSGEAMRYFTMVGNDAMVQECRVLMAAIQGPSDQPNPRQRPSFPDAN